LPHKRLYVPHPGCDLDSVVDHFPHSERIVIAEQVGQKNMNKVLGAARIAFHSANGLLSDRQEGGPAAGRTADFPPAPAGGHPGQGLAAPGASTARLKYRDTSTGAPWLTVAATGFSAVEQQESVS
jgi:hypothetical protein